jgi:hypothetical protein
MKRKVLAIPREEIEAHFAENSRQDLKMVNAEILSYDLFKVLKARGKDLKMEEPLLGMIWSHSGPDQPNKVCAAGDFADLQLPQYASGPFGISIASATSVQDEHYHKQHLEIVVSNEPLSIEFRDFGGTQCERISLPRGGLLVTTPNIVHKLEVTGLTFLIELPAMARDKYDIPLHP